MYGFDLIDDDENDFSTDDYLPNLYNINDSGFPRETINTQVANDDYDDYDDYNDRLESVEGLMDDGDDYNDRLESVEGLMDDGESSSEEPHEESLGLIDANFAIPSNMPEELFNEEIVEEENLENDNAFFAEVDNYISALPDDNILPNTNILTDINAYFALDSEIFTLDETLLNPVDFSNEIDINEVGEVNNDNNDNIRANTIRWILKEPLSFLSILINYKATMEALKIQENGTVDRPQCLGLIRRKSGANNTIGSRCKQNSYYKIGVQLCFQHYVTLLNLRYQGGENYMVSPLYSIVAHKGYSHFSLIEQLLLKTKQLYRGMDIYHKIIRDDIKTDSARNFIKVIEVDGNYFIVTDMYINTSSDITNSANELDNDTTIHVFSPSVTNLDGIDQEKLLKKIYKHTILQRDKEYESVFRPKYTTSRSIAVNLLVNENINKLYKGWKNDDDTPGWYNNVDVTGLATVAMVKSIASGVNPSSRFFFNLIDHIMRIFLLDEHKKYFSKKIAYNKYHIQGKIADDYNIQDHISIVDVATTVAIRMNESEMNTDREDMNSFAISEYNRYELNTSHYRNNINPLNANDFIKNVTSQFPLYLHPCSVYDGTVNNGIKNIRVLTPKLTEIFQFFFDTRHECARLEHTPITIEDRGILSESEDENTNNDNINNDNNPQNISIVRPISLSSKKARNKLNNWENFYDDTRLT